MVFLGDFSFVVEFFFINFFFRDLTLSFVFDYISLLFFSAVSLISFVVFLYRKFYFQDSLTLLNYTNIRYSYLLSLFVFSIFFLVFSGSFLTTIIGWDGLGLVSFLLVIFYRNPSSLNSGLVTIFTNRVGDCLFILSFLMMCGGGWFFIDFLPEPYFWGFVLLVILGCLTKRAQVPFSSWLPRAMSAPTPISSLVHSSTLVTAGVYLMVRFNFLFDSVYWLITPLSLFTLLLGGVVALYEVDLKKVVAISTLSQLGFIVFTISLGYWSLGFFHIVFHAFFKRSMFLRLGNLMHYLKGSQDSRDFGSLNSSYFSKLIFCTRCLSLSGFPFSLGFYSKDLIVGVLSYNEFSLFSFIFFFGCSLSVAYRIRLISLCFFGGITFSASTEFRDSRFFFIPIIVIFFICVVSGNFFSFYFFPPLTLSLLDFCVGLVLIFIGIFIFYFSRPLFLDLFSSMFFLSLITSYFSNILFVFPKKEESSWGELTSGSGFYLLVSYFQLSFKHLLRVNSYLPVFLTVLFLLLILT